MLWGLDQNEAYWSYEKVVQENRNWNFRQATHSPWSCHKCYQICNNWSDTSESTTFTKRVFPFIFFIFYTIFCSFSQNKLGRQDVPFVVMGHIYAILIYLLYRANQVDDMKSYYKGYFWSKHNKFDISFVTIYTLYYNAGSIPINILPYFVHRCMYNMYKTLFSVGLHVTPWSYY